MNEEQGHLKLSRLRLDSMPLPQVDDNGDKESRGIVLAIGGSTSIPGAIMLAALGALRAGAGKLQIATARGVAVNLGVAVPEALVRGLATNRQGEISGTAASSLADLVANARAIVVGPGMQDRSQILTLLTNILPEINPTTTLVLDGSALSVLDLESGLLDALEGNVILTPHAGEMAALLEIPRDEVLADPAGIAQHCADGLRAVVVLKGGESFIAAPDAPLLNYRDGKAGLATSGSGDVLAGVIAGLAARGASPLVAAAWGVWAHGSAGNNLARRIGPVGFLARELLLEFPALLQN